MATGMARGAAARSKRIAFGDGKRIIWGPWSEEIFRHNPNIARPGSERDRDIEWVHYYKGNRLYNRHSPDRWIWNMEFRSVPGEVFFSDNEKAFATSIDGGFILIEPNVPQHKSCASNKDWGQAKYQAVVDVLTARGNRVVQSNHGKRRLAGVSVIETQSFRAALAVLSRARLAILPEGGLHHGAAALGIPAVVIFGGFIPPQVTGYDMHTNLTGGATACGSLRPCAHCRAALDAITVDDVIDAAGQSHAKA
jgi:hypothetical protein